MVLQTLTLRRHEKFCQDLDGSQGNFLQSFLARDNALDLTFYATLPIRAGEFMSVRPAIAGLVLRPFLDNSLSLWQSPPRALRYYNMYLRWGPMLCI